MKKKKKKKTRRGKKGKKVKTYNIKNSIRICQKPSELSFSIVQNYGIHHSATSPPHNIYKIF